jgi:hypothetical protein
MKFQVQRDLLLYAPYSLLTTSPRSFFSQSCQRFQMPALPTDTVSALGTRASVITTTQRRNHVPMELYEHSTMVEITVI